MRRTVKPKSQVMSMASALLSAEREAWKQRMREKVEFSKYGRPLCQYCGAEEAHHTGNYRTNGSAILRKYKKLYIGPNCHRSMYNLPTYWGRLHERDSEVEAY